MAVKFFGQYLLEQGLINREQLLQAIDLQRESNPVLGELAVQHEMLTEAQAQRINDLQRQEDKRFGDIAMLLGLLTGDQVDTLLKLQKKRRKMFGQIVVEQGMLSEEQLQSALEAHQVEREEALQDLESGITDHPLAGVINVAMATCSTQFTRILRSFCQFSSLVQSDADVAEFDVTGHVLVEAFSPLMIGLSCSRETMYNIAKAFMRLPNAPMDDELAQDAMGELVNVLMGYVVKDTLPDDARYSASPPDFSIPLTSLMARAKPTLAVTMTCELGSFALAVGR